MKNKITNIVFVLFSICWILFVLMEYANKHPNHLLSFQYFRYGKFTVILGGLLGACSALYYFVKPARKILTSGLFFYFVFLMSIIGICLSTGAFIKNKTDSSNYLYALGRSSYFMGAIILIYTSMHAIGSLIFSRFVKSKYLQFDLLKIIIGIIVMLTIMIILGAFGGLSKFVLWPLFLIPIGLNYKNLLPFVKKIFISPVIEPKKENFIATFLIYIMVVFVTINLFSSQAPFPFGFDSRNFYVNISRLIGQSGGLVEGFQPYAWSLFMALGYLLFDSPEITHHLSSTAALLAVFYVYRICTKYFNFSATESVLVMLLFLITPSVFNQLYAELKIDFALLFFQLALLDLVFLFIRQSEKQKTKDTASSTKDFMKIEKLTILIVLMGIISGYAMSIKFTHLFFLFAVLIGLWAYFTGLKGFLASFTLCFGFVLLVRLDDISGLRYYHLGGTTFSIVLLIFGLLALGYVFRSNKSGVLQSMRASIIIGVLSIGCLSPWLIKNFIETKSLSPIELLLGKDPGPQLNIQTFEKNYKKYKKLK